MLLEYTLLLLNKTDVIQAVLWSDRLFLGLTINTLNDIAACPALQAISSEFKVWNTLSSTVVYPEPQEYGDYYTYGIYECILLGFQIGLVIGQGVRFLGF